jgi:cell division protein FtsZ
MMEKAERDKQRREEARRENLRTYTYMNPTKLSNSETIATLTNEPAFRRRKVSLDDVPHSSENQMSRWTLSGDEEPEINDDNSFLHDNVD